MKDFVTVDQLQDAIIKAGYRGVKPYQVTKALIPFCKEIDHLGPRLSLINSNYEGVLGAINKLKRL